MAEALSAQREGPRGTGEQREHRRTDAPKHTLYRVMHVEIAKSEARQAIGQATRLLVLEHNMCACAYSCAVQ